MTEFTTWRSLVDGAEISEIPDAVAHYDAFEIDATDGDSKTSWTDLTGNFDVSGGSSIEYKTNGINGNPSLEFSGGSPLENSEAEFDQPITIVAVTEFMDSDLTNAGVPVGNIGDQFEIMQGRGDGFDSLRAGEDLDVGNTENSPSLLIGVFDGTESKARRNASDESTGDVGQNNMDGIRMGEDSNGSNSYDGQVGEVKIFDRKLSSEEISSIENELLDKWDFE